MIYGPVTREISFIIKPGVQTPLFLGGWMRFEIGVPIIRFINNMLVV